MLSFVTRFANRYEPIDWFLPDIYSRISFVMNLSSGTTAVYTTPIISLEYNIPFSLPIIRLKIFISIVITSLFTYYIKSPTLK